MALGLNMGELTHKDWGTMATRHAQKVIELIEKEEYLEAILVVNEVICCLVNAVKKKE